LNSHNAQKYINRQVQVANVNPQRATVGRPFRVAIPSACSNSYKAKALPYVLSIKQIKVAEGPINGFGWGLRRSI